LDNNNTPLPIDINSSTSDQILSSLYILLPTGNELKTLITLINSQIKKLFVFYIDFERKIYIQVNKKLNKQSYHNRLSIKEICLELKKLREILQTLTYFILFMKVNLLAIKKMIYKFDYYLGDYLGDVTLIYLRSLLENPSSDLNYLINMKIVVEVNVLTSFLTNELLEQVSILTNQQIENVRVDSNLSNEKFTKSFVAKQDIQPRFIRLIDEDDFEEVNDIQYQPNDKIKKVNEDLNNFNIEVSLNSNETPESKDIKNLDENRNTRGKVFDSVASYNEQNNLHSLSKNTEINSVAVQSKADEIKNNDNRNKLDSIYYLDNKSVLNDISRLREEIEFHLENLDILTEEIRQNLSDWQIVAQEEAEKLNLNPQLQIRNQTLPHELEFFRKLVNHNNKADFSKISHNNAIFRKLSIYKDGKVLFKDNDQKDDLTNTVKNSSKYKKSFKQPSVFTNMNMRNIVLCLLHTFTYMFIYSIASPTNSKYLKSMGLDESITGIVLAATPLAAIFSTIFFSYWTSTSYKKPIIATLLCFIAGNFLYAFAFHFKSFLMVFFGRFLIGVGCGRIVNRRYLIDYIPISLSTNYSLYYTLATSFGLAMGPLLTIFFTYIPECNIGILYINQFTIPGVTGFIFCVIVFFSVLVLFTEPINNPNFSAYNNLKSESNSTKKLSDDNISSYSENYLDKNLLPKTSSASESDFNPQKRQELSKTLLDLNNKLDEINNQFTTTDCFKKKLNDQVKLNSFDEIRVCFILFSFSLTLCRVSYYKKLFLDFCRIANGFSSYIFS
jgi:hypothetical protein